MTYCVLQNVVLYQILCVHKIQKGFTSGLETTCLKKKSDEEEFQLLNVPTKA